LSIYEALFDGEERNVKQKKDDRSRGEKKTKAKLRDRPPMDKKKPE